MIFFSFLLFKHWPKQKYACAKKINFLNQSISWFNYDFYFLKLLLLLLIKFNIYFFKENFIPTIVGSIYWDSLIKNLYVIFIDWLINQLWSPNYESFINSNWLIMDQLTLFCTNKSCVGYLKWNNTFFKLAWYKINSRVVCNRQWIWSFIIYEYDWFRNGHYPLKTSITK